MSLSFPCSTCKSRRWECSHLPCLGTCVAYGDGHFITFDGEWYSFDGSCEYTLAQDHCGGNGSTNGTFRIVTENVPCGTTGVTCSKAIKLFLEVRGVWNIVPQSVGTSPTLSHWQRQGTWPPSCTMSRGVRNKWHSPGTENQGGSLSLSVPRPRPQRPGVPGPRSFRRLWGGSSHPLLGPGECGRPLPGLRDHRAPLRVHAPSLLAQGLQTLGSAPPKSRMIL